MPLGILDTLGARQLRLRVGWMDFVKGSVRAGSPIYSYLYDNSCVASVINSMAVPEAAPSTRL